MSCRIEDSRGGFFAVPLFDDDDSREWSFQPWYEDETPQWCVCVGHLGCHITIVDGPYDSHEDAVSVARALNTATSGARP